MINCQLPCEVPVPCSIYASDYIPSDTHSHKLTTMMKNALLLPPLCKRLLVLMTLLCSTGILFAQQRQVTGKVVAADNPDSSVAGATITVKGGHTSTVTGNDGSFSLMASPNSTLVISSIGFLTQEVPVGNRSSVTVRLASNQQSIQQVVVIGYGTAKRKDLTGAIASVSADQIEKVPVTTFEQALQGRAPGVQVTKTMPLPAVVQTCSSAVPAAWPSTVTPRSMWSTAIPSRPAA